MVRNGEPDPEWMAERVLKNLPAYLRRYSPEMRDELVREDAAYASEEEKLPRDRREEPIQRAAKRLQEMLEET